MELNGIKGGKAGVATEDGVFGPLTEGLFPETIKTNIGELKPYGWFFDKDNDEVQSLTAYISEPPCEITFWQLEVDRWGDTLRADTSSEGGNEGEFSSTYNGIEEIYVDPEFKEIVNERYEEAIEEAEEEYYDYIGDEEGDSEEFESEESINSAIEGGLMDYKVGDKIKIIEMVDEPEYSGKTGTIEHIDGRGQLHGTWGSLAVIPEEDTIEIVDGQNKPTFQPEDEVERELFEAMGPRKYTDDSYLGMTSEQRKRERARRRREAAKGVKAEAAKPAEKPVETPVEKPEPEKKVEVSKPVEKVNPNTKFIHYRDIMDYVRDLGYTDLARKIWRNSDIIESKDWNKIFETFGGGPVAEAFIHFGFDPLFGLKEIPNRYMSGSSIREFKFPQGITKIGSSAFANCSSLESLTIPDSVTSIGGSAFDGCTSLKTLVIPDSVTYIEGYAFRGCTSLEEVVLPKGLSSIGVELFKGCSSLTSVNLPAGLKQIGVRAFEGCRSLIKLVIPDSVTVIGQEAFSECSAEIVIGENSDLSKIGDWAFYYSGSNKLFIPDGVSELGNGVLEYCSASEITLGRGLRSIGDKSLDGCRNLSKLTYRGTKNGWKSIKKYRDFGYYIDVSEVHCSDGVTKIYG